MIPRLGPGFDDAADGLRLARSASPRPPSPAGPAAVTVNVRSSALSLTTCRLNVKVVSESPRSAGSLGIQADLAAGVDLDRDVERQLDSRLAVRGDDGDAGGARRVGGNRRRPAGPRPDRCRSAGPPERPMPPPSSVADQEAGTPVTSRLTRPSSFASTFEVEADAGVGARDDRREWRRQASGPRRRARPARGRRAR